LDLNAFSSKIRALWSSRCDKLQSSLSCPDRCSENSDDDIDCSVFLISSVVVVVAVISVPLT